MGNKHDGTNSAWRFLYFNPRAAGSYEAWRAIFKARRICRETDRLMKKILPPEGYAKYQAATQPKHKRGLLARLFGGGK